MPIHIVAPSRLDARRLFNSLATNPIVAQHFRLSREKLATQVLNGKREYLGDDIAEIAREYGYHVDTATFYSYLDEIQTGRNLDFWQGIYHIALDGHRGVLVVSMGEAFLNGSQLIDADFQNRVLRWNALDLSARKDGSVPDIPDSSFNTTSGQIQFSSPNFEWDVADRLKLHYLDRDIRFNVRGRVWVQGKPRPTSDNLSGGTVPIVVPSKRPVHPMANATTFSTSYAGTYDTSSMDTASGTPQWSSDGPLVVDVSNPNQPQITFNGVGVAATSITIESASSLAWNDANAGTAASLNFFTDPVTGNAAFTGYLATASAGINPSNGTNFSGHLHVDDPTGSATLGWTVAGAVAGIVGVAGAIAGVIVAVAIYRKQKATEVARIAEEVELGERVDVDANDRQHYEQLVKECRQFGVDAREEIADILKLNPSFKIVKPEDYTAEIKQLEFELSDWKAQRAKLDEEIGKVDDARTRREKRTHTALTAWTNAEGALKAWEADPTYDKASPKTTTLEADFEKSRRELEKARRQLAEVEKQHRDLLGEVKRRDRVLPQMRLQHTLYEKLEPEYRKMHHR